ncbi:hypothetical protein V1638_12670 [Pseudarthrobacter sp. J64]|uniref:hypothetical protein n=1 Tax=Pseudarthrobacter sp. J64 TaxID=3116485 RepID=UPI002E81D5F8|nr:hypothetical protein [Pseudarthrobacter sp. J64]MEE2570243.1 hypothetical protein [Pseudarthrobacter sp. J64]
MKPRGILLLATCLLAAVLVVIALSSNTSRICPAIGYAYTGDTELVFSSQPASVAACFGEGCQPQPVAANAEGRWLVPQAAPYLNRAAPVSVVSIRVEAVAVSGGTVSADLPIETESTGEHPHGPMCGGPFVFKPVNVVFS